MDDYGDESGRIIYAITILYLQEAEGGEAVAVGAVLSDYQRVRVENVCTRLGLTCLAYLWSCDQKELYQEMIDCQMNAVLVKTACIGKRSIARQSFSFYPLTITAFKIF